MFCLGALGFSPGQKRSGGSLRIAGQPRKIPKFLVQHTNKRVCSRAAHGGAACRFSQNPGPSSTVSFGVLRSLHGSPTVHPDAAHLLAKPPPGGLVETNLGDRIPDRFWPAGGPAQRARTRPRYADKRDQLQPGPGNRRPESLIGPSPSTSPDPVHHRIACAKRHDSLSMCSPAFGTDGPGELGLQAFNLAQVRSPLALPAELWVACSAPAERERTT